MHNLRSTVDIFAVNYTKCSHHLVKKEGAWKAMSWLKEHDTRKKVCPEIKENI